ncbi:unnamed protein product [Caenorhabditis angaria]|uniref:Histone deacetylase domain-containing protein n=1 Tax=Caenorhabditis angaria TaxID=860376 RepID=A0A9P1IQA3_9PELO|nr:unnamed protein product [Caenorhabditis angaria]
MRKNLFVQSIDEVYEKPAGQRNAFVIIRPPGHHASSSKSSGFCIFNNVAIAAKYAQKKHGAKKVLILDWDVHHGNGTQEIFYEDSTVFYMSIHRHDKGSFYPIGEPKDTFDIGEEAGKGYSLNIPFDGISMGDFEYQTAFNKIILPVAYQFNPDLVLISAGFDAAANDPLGEFELSPEVYALMTYQLMSLAEGRVVTVLEGGYNLTAISNSALAVAEVMKNRGMARRIWDEKEQFASERRKLKSDAVRSIREVAQIHQKYWPILNGFQKILGAVTNSQIVTKTGKVSTARKSATSSNKPKKTPKTDRNTPRRSPRFMSELEKEMEKLGIS